MKREDKEKIIDSELTELWSEGLNKESSARLIDALSRARSIEPAQGLKSKILARTKRHSVERKRWVSLIPVTAPALVLLLLLLRTPSQNSIVSKGITSVQEQQLNLVFAEVLGEEEGSLFESGYAWFDAEQGDGFNALYGEFFDS